MSPSRSDTGIDVTADPLRPGDHADTDGSLDRLLAEVAAMQELLGGIDLPGPPPSEGRSRDEA